jgi:hypothetical protein
LSRFTLLLLWFVAFEGWCAEPPDDEYGWRTDGVLMPDTPHQGHDGPFLALLFVTDRAEALYEDWFTKPDKPKVTNLDLTVPGTTVEAVVVFVHCQPDADGHCQVWGTATVTTSDGRTLLDAVEVPLYVGHPSPPGAALGISEHGIGMVVEDIDGWYRFQVLVEDRVAGRKVSLVQELTVKAK